MKELARVTAILITFFLAACSVNLPKKPSADSIWHLRPPVTSDDGVKKPFGVVVEKPWLASGYDTRSVLVSMEDNEIDALAGAVWSDNHGEWLRNYFIEGFQSSGQFSSVTGSQRMRGNLVFLKIYLWNLSMHYPEGNREQPVIKAKLGVSITNGKGEKLTDQQIIESQVPVSENRLGPVMAGFDRVLADCFGQIRGVLEDL